MFSLEQLLGTGQGDRAVQEISNSVGASPSAVDAAIQVALPMLINGLANNASTPQGAEDLNTALEQDHDGGILDNLGGLQDMIFGGGRETAPPRQADAGGILDHILGRNQAPVVKEASERSGLGVGQVAQIVMMLAPIVMGYLGRQKQEQGIDAGGLGGLLDGLLGSQATAAPHSPGTAGGIFDRDGDGSSIDDIASIAFDYLGNRR